MGCMRPTRPRHADPTRCDTPTRTPVHARALRPPARALPPHTSAHVHAARGYHNGHACPRRCAATPLPLTRQTRHSDTPRPPYAYLARRDADTTAHAHSPMPT